MPAAPLTKTEFACLDPADPEWDRLIKKCQEWHPFYLAGIVKAGAAFHKAVAKLLVIQCSEGVAVYPVLAFPLPTGTKPSYDLCGQPYAGPISSATDPTIHMQLVTALRNAIAGAAQSHGWVTNFCRLNPFSPTPISDQDVKGGADQVYVDLTLGYDRIWNEYTGAARKNVKRANNGTGELRPLKDEWDYLLFAKLYARRMKELEAPARYHFDEKYFQALYQNSRDNCLALGAFLNEQLVGGCLNFRANDYLFSYLLAVDYGYQELRLSHGLNDLAIRLGVRDGDKIYVLGGGVRGADSVFTYKKSFSAKSFLQVSLNIILDQNRYDQMCAGRLSYNRNMTFFPPWREEQNASP